MKLKACVLLLVFWLAPASARADGFLDWLEKLSGPKFVGLSGDFQVLCFDVNGKRYKWCDFTRDARNTDVKHMLDARVGYYFKYGSRFSDVTDDRGLQSYKLMAVYRYRVEKWLDLGGGIGYMGFHGDGLTDSVPRLLLMPAT